MSWLKSVWTRKVAISVDGSGAAATIDPDVEIPGEFDDFWSTIDNSGNELRVVDYAGTVQDYALSGFNKTNRTGTIRLNNVQMPAVACVGCLWLFYGSTTNQGSSGGVAGTGGVNGYLELAEPRGPYLVQHRPQIPGSTGLLNSYHKATAERVMLWTGYSHVLSAAWTPAYGGPLMEEPRYATYSVLNTSGGAEASMAEVGSARFVWHPRKGLYLGVPILGGTTATSYTSSVVLRVGNPVSAPDTNSKIFDSRVGWRVRDNRY